MHEFSSWSKEQPMQVVEENIRAHVKMTSNYGVLMKSAKSFDDNQFSTIKNDNDFMPPCLFAEISTQKKKIHGKIFPRYAVL